MKAVAFILFIFFYLLPVQGQTNLILNGRFEETVFPDSCYAGPIYKEIFLGLNSRHLIRDWWNPINSSPDYNHRCDTTNTTGVPLNTLGGYQEDPYSENAYVGLCTLPYNPEYVMTHLKHPIENNKTYLFKYLVCASDVSIAKSNIGVSFVADSIDDTTFFAPIAPVLTDYVFMTDTAITNCMNWTEFSIEFVAHTDSLKFVIIGNFPTVKPLIKVFTTLSEMCAPPLLDSSESYYLIDDVRLYCLDCDTIDSTSTTDSIPNVIACDMAFPDAFTPNGDNVNDTWKPIITAECDSSISNYLLRIYDCWDNEIFKTSDKNEGWTGAHKQTGTYIYFIQYDNQHGIQKKTGSITLIR